MMASHITCSDRTDSAARLLISGSLQTSAMSTQQTQQRVSPSSAAATAARVRQALSVQALLQRGARVCNQHNQLAQTKRKGFEPKPRRCGLAGPLRRKPTKVKPKRRHAAHALSALTLPARRQHRETRDGGFRHRSGLVIAVTCFRDRLYNRKSTTLWLQRQGIVLIFHSHNFSWFPFTPGHVPSSYAQGQFAHASMVLLFCSQLS